jgi:hypothetical protein
MPTRSFIEPTREASGIWTKDVQKGFGIGSIVPVNPFMALMALLRLDR